jgi:hypothetical protein
VRKPRTWGVKKAYGGPRDRKKVFVFVGRALFWGGEPFFVGEAQEKQTNKQTNETNKQTNKKPNTFFYFWKAKDLVCNQE